MDKFKTWVKRPVNFNMASLLLIAAILLIFAAICFGSYLESEAELNSLKTEINRVRSQDEIDDVEGYGLIINSIGYAIGAIGGAFILGYFVFIPVIIALVIIAFSVVSRVIYSAVSSKRLLAYRIVSGFGYFFMLAAFLLYSLIFFLRYCSSNTGNCF